ncbi:hypothetical protein IGI04_039829 [Brassica rapa subsp. trilocularis]|uniref:Uncharacterized protein n=3 Tax=Brassica campestris TaxID=3711 RepID=A0A8D9FWJ3_BRACM|nr:hypothetical protein IGI04_039829 [Brassica rapa subsp. trilocularis]CAG7860640.1 unnamed protein product [Brassica rapa]
MNGSRKQSIVYAVRDYPPLKESSVACSATTTDGARSLTMLWLVLRIPVHDLLFHVSYETQ